MVYIWSLLLDIFTKKNYQCYYLSCFSCYSSFHYFFYCYCDSCLHYWCINVILSLSLQMVSAKSKRGLIKELYISTRASKGNRCLNSTSQSFDSLLQSVIRYAHSKSDSYKWQHRDTLLNLHSQDFLINYRLDTLTGLQPPITTKQYELRIRCGHVTTMPNQWISAYLWWPVKKWIRLEKWIRPRRKWASLPRCGKT